MLMRVICFQWCSGQQRGWVSLLFNTFIIIMLLSISKQIHPSGMSQCGSNLSNPVNSIHMLWNTCCKCNKWLFKACSFMNPASLLWRFLYLFFICTVPSSTEAEAFKGANSQLTIVCVCAYVCSPRSLHMAVYICLWTWHQGTHLHALAEFIALKRQAL